LTDEEGGVAALFRWRHRPVAFVMIADLAPGATVSPEALADVAVTHGAIGLVETRIADELRAASGIEADAPLPSLTVAVCTRDRADDLAECLRSLLAVRDATPGGFEVLVVENAPSNDATARLLEPLPGVRRCVEPRPGLDFARNRAVAEATGDFVAFIDDDVRVDPGWYRGLAAALADNPDAGCVTGLVLAAELETDAQVLFERRGGFRRGCRRQRFAGPIQPGNPLYPAGAGIFGAGCNMVFRRDLLVELGGFDEALDTGPPLPGGGDLDAFYRVVRHGAPLVYEPAMLVFHRHRRDLDGLARQYWSWGEGMMAFVAKSWSVDVEQRWKLTRLVLWWSRATMRELARARRGRSELPASLVAAELRGGVVGLMGSYGRSRRRSARITRGRAAAPPGAVRARTTS
jgi:GT2 family glycosyltransferase